LWPRGLAKADVKIDLWLKDIAPSKDLRKWYGHETEKWSVFKIRYFEELNHNPKQVERLIHEVNQRPVIFLFSSKEVIFNNAVALKEYIEGKL
jgi:uncharacterized protein YeaO (DUF488 family)